MSAARGKIVVEGGKAAGPALVLTAPISFWGGIDPKTGAVIDVRHPQCGTETAGTVLFVPATMGSSTASTILLELVSNGCAPAAIVLHEPDAILLLGLVAAREMNLAVPPALVLDRKLHDGFAGRFVGIEADGTILAGDRPSGERG